MNRVAFIVNPHSGGGRRQKELQDVFKKNNIESKNIFYLSKDKNVQDIVKEISEADFTTVVALGGDGTVSSVASALLQQDLKLKLGVIPIGTLNHFARDIGMPLTLSAAIEIIQKNKSMFIDVGKVNDIFFINNSSLGIYPAIVEEREQHERRGLSKWLALCLTLFFIFKKQPVLTISFSTHGRETIKETSFVFIGNNKYQLSGLGIGKRTKLDENTLSVAILNHVSTFKLISIGIRALFGNIMAEKDFNVIGLQSCFITSKKNTLLVSYDGEVKKIPVPLQYQILPKALSVIIP